MMKGLVLLGLCTVLLSGCKKSEEQPQPTNTNGTLQMVVKATANGQDIQLERSKVVTTLGDTVVPRLWYFFLSNIELVDTIRNQTWKEQNSYHLVKFSREANSFSFNLANIPTGFTVHKINLGFGVDSLANSSSAYLGKGDLLLGTGMEWSWTDGWKFFLLEGNYKSGTSNANGGLVYHIGFNNNYRKLVCRLAPALQPTLKGGQVSTLVWQANLKEVFGGATRIDVTQVNNEMGRNTSSAAIANNYATALFLQAVSLTN